MPGEKSIVIFRKGIIKMAENVLNEKTGNTVVVVNQKASSAIGICALIFAILGFFFLAILFVPLSLIMSAIALFKKQYAWGISALIIALIAAMTSPTLLLMLGFAAR